jgi:hypothetical protein
MVVLGLSRVVREFLRWKNSPDVQRMQKNKNQLKQQDVYFYSMSTVNLLLHIVGCILPSDGEKGSDFKAL